MLREQQKTLEARSYQLRKVSKEYKPRIVVTNKELGLKLLLEDYDEPQLFLHSELEDLDKLIKENAPEGLDISIDPNYGRGGTSRGRGWVTQREFSPPDVEEEVTPP